MSQPNDSRHFTGKKSPFRTQKRNKKVKSKRVHRNKYERRWECEDFRRNNYQVQKW